MQGCCVQFVFAKRSALRVNGNYYRKEKGYLTKARYHHSTRLKYGKNIRLGGRLRDVLLSIEEKHPYIPYSNANTIHGGAALTLNHFRMKCSIRNRRNADVTRIRPQNAFTSDGINYAGPINISPS